MKTIKVQAEEFLQQPKGVKKSYLRILFFYIFLIIGYSIFLALTVKYGPFKNDSIVDSIGFSKNLFSNKDLSNAVTIISIISFVFMVLPFICLFSLWIIGINQVSKSPYFHFFLWLTCVLLSIILIIVMIIFIRATLYNFAADYN